MYLLAFILAVSSVILKLPIFADMSHNPQMSLCNIALKNPFRNRPKKVEKQAYTGNSGKGV